MTKFKDNGKLKLLIIVGTRPEIIRLAAVINKCRQYFDCLLAHTGQNYDYNLNGVFFKDLKLADPDIYMEAVGEDLGATMGNIIDKSYKVMVETKPDAVLVLGDTNSCLSVIGADTVGNGLVVGIIGTTLDHGAALDALLNDLVRNHQGNDTGHILIPGFQHLVQVNGLLDSAGEAVQKESFHMRISSKSIGNHSFHHHIGHEIALLYERLRLLAQLGAGGNLAAEKFSGGDVFQVKLFHQRGCVGAFPGPGRAEHNEILHKNYSST